MLVRYSFVHYFLPDWALPYSLYRVFATAQCAFFAGVWAILGQVLLCALSAPLGVIAISTNISNSITFKALADLALVVPSSYFSLSVSSKESIFDDTVSGILIFN